MLMDQIHRKKKQHTLTNLQGKQKLLINSPNTLLFPQFNISFHYSSVMTRPSARSGYNWES